MVCIRNSAAGPFGVFFFFQAEDGIRDLIVTGVQTCALPISQAEDGIRDLIVRSEEHTSELQSRSDLVCRLLLEKRQQIRPLPVSRSAILRLLQVRIIVFAFAMAMRMHVD